MLRYGAGDAQDGYGVTAMFYRGLWERDHRRAGRSFGQIGRFGTLDPSDGGQAMRKSLSGQYHAGIGDGHFDANAYVINNRLTLWNNFTHFLDDPINGDQEAQNEARATFGGGASYARSDTPFGFGNDLLAGLQTRTDDVHVDRLATKQRIPLSVTTTTASRKPAPAPISRPRPTGPTGCAA